MIALILATGLFLQPFNPGLPLTGGSSFTNLHSDAAWTNASAHVAWATAVPLVGERIGGRKGLWVAGLSWVGLTLVTESLFHMPKGGGGSEYPAEVRTDLISRLVPCLAVMLGSVVLD